MTEVKQGDRVRCVLGESVLIGTVNNVEKGCVWIVPDGANPANRLATPPWMVEVLTPALPPEPPVGSVVQNVNGSIWKRTLDGWQGPLQRWTWAHLNERYAPLVLLVPADQIIDDLRALAVRHYLVEALAAKYGVTP